MKKSNPRGEKKVTFRFQTEKGKDVFIAGNFNDWQPGKTRLEDNGAGVVFGVINGSIAVSIGATLGATCAFLVGRYLARDWVARRIAGKEKFKAVDEAVAREGWKIVLLTRLSPVFPFNLLNYAFGLTRVSIRHYFFASWLGMIPGTVMYVYIGSLAGDLASLAAGGHTRTLDEWILYGVGLLATIAVTIFVTRLARNALATRVSS